MFLILSLIFPDKSANLICSDWRQFDRLMGRKGRETDKNRWSRWVATEDRTNLIGIFAR